MKARISLAAILLLAAAGALAAGYAGARHVEATLAARVEAALSAAGAHWARVELDGLTGRLAGRAPDAARREAALRIARRAAPELSLEMAAETAPPPVAATPPWRADIIIGGGEALTTGRLSAADARALTEALKRRAPGLGLRAFLTAAGAAPEDAPWEATAEAAEFLDQGRVTVSEGRIAAIGLAKTAEAAASLTALGARLGPGWRLDANVRAPVAMADVSPDVAAAAAPEPEPATPSPAPPPPQPRDYALTVARTEDGRARLSGEAPGGGAAERLRAYARAAFPGAAPDLSVKTGEAPAPAGWRRAAMAAIDALALLQSGEAKIGGGAALVTGRAEGWRALRAAHGRLAAGAPEGWRVESRITLSPRIAAEAQPLPASRCVERLAALVAERPLVFEPGEFRLTPEGEAALARLIPVVRRCAGGRIEIGGHTDSQGRETTNMALSRARAETVLDRLISAGAPPGLFSAKGYGETRPVASNADAAGRARNRRIEFTLLEDGT